DAGAALEIELRFVEDSWTEVTAAGGERLFYGLARAGAEERILADSEVRVLLGNADGVIVRVNGAPFAYPSGSRNGDLARFRRSPENQEESWRPPIPPSGPWTPWCGTSGCCGIGCRLARWR